MKYDKCRRAVFEGTSATLTLSLKDADWSLMERVLGFSQGGVIPANDLMFDGIRVTHEPSGEVIWPLGVDMTDTTDTTGTANDRQVGGSHYQTEGDQHWDICSRHDAGYLEGTLTAYVWRWRDKNGLEDLEKTRHYLQKLWEMTNGTMHHTSGGSVPCGVVSRWLEKNEIPETEARIITYVLSWRIIGKSHLRTVGLLIDKLITEESTRGWVKGTLLSAAEEDTETETMGRYVGTAPSSSQENEKVEVWAAGTPEDGGHHARDEQRWPTQVSAEQYIQWNCEPVEKIDHGPMIGMPVTEIYYWDAGERLHIMQDVYQERYGDDSIVPRLSETERHQPNLTAAEYRLIRHKIIEHGTMMDHEWGSLYRHGVTEAHSWHMQVQYREEYAR